MALLRSPEGPQGAWYCNLLMAYEEHGDRRELQRGLGLHPRKQLLADGLATKRMPKLGTKTGLASGTAAATIFSGGVGAIRSPS